MLVQRIIRLQQLIRHYRAHTVERSKERVFRLAGAGDATLSEGECGIGKQSDGLLIHILAEQRNKTTVSRKINSGCASENKDIPGQSDLRWWTLGAEAATTGATLLRGPKRSAKIRTKAQWSIHHPALTGVNPALQRLQHTSTRCFTAAITVD